MLHHGCEVVAGLLFTQKYTSLVDDTHSFVECGGTSIDAVLMTDDIRHAFSIHCTPAAAALDAEANATAVAVSSDARQNENDKLILLLDKILHCPLSNVVQYISLQLHSFSNSHFDAAAEKNDKNDGDDIDDKKPLITEDLLKDVPSREQQVTATCIQNDTASGTNLSSNTGYHLQPVRDTPPTHDVVNSHQESVQFSESEPAVKRLRTIVSNDAKLARMMTGKFMSNYN